MGWRHQRTVLVGFKFVRVSITVLVFISLNYIASFSTHTYAHTHTHTTIQNNTGALVRTVHVINKMLFSYCVNITLFDVINYSTENVWR